MNFYILILCLLGLLPLIHLVLIAFIIKNKNTKIPQVTVINVLLSLEIVFVLLSIIFPIPDGGVFIYYISVDFIGIFSLILQYFSCMAVKANRTNITILNIIWGIAIIAGLIFWMIYYLVKLLPVIFS